jgi:hypothetical protein
MSEKSRLPVPRALEALHGGKGLIGVTLSGLRQTPNMV